MEQGPLFSVTLPIFTSEMFASLGIEQRGGERLRVKELCFFPAGNHQEWRRSSLFTPCFLTMSRFKEMRWEGFRHGDVYRFVEEGGGCGQTAVQQGVKAE